MSAITLPDLSDRVDELARQLEELRNTPQDTIGTVNTFLEKKDTGMNFDGPWNRESPYEPENVVRYKRQSFVNVAPIAAFPPVGVAPKPNGEPARARMAALEIKQYIDEQEAIEGPLLPTDPAIGSVYLGNNIAWLFEFRTPSGSKITIPPGGEEFQLPRYGEGRILLRYEIYNSDGESQIVGEHGELKEAEVKGGADKTLFFLVVIATYERGGKEVGEVYVKPVVPVPFLMELASTGGLTSIAGNPPPSTDLTHWRLLASAPGGTSSTRAAGSIQVRGELVLPAGAPGVIAKLEPGTVDWDVSGFWSAETHRYTPTKPGIYLISVAFQGLETVPSGGWTDVTAAKNTISLGNIYARNMSSSASAGPEGGCSGLVQMNGVTDFLDLRGGAHTGTGASVKGIAFLDVAYLGPEK